MASRAIKAGEGDVYIAGGVKSMSRAPYSLPKAEAGFSFGNLTAYDTALGWRYPNPKMKAMHGTNTMGETAENALNVRTLHAKSRMSSLRIATLRQLLPFKLGAFQTGDRACYYSSQKKGDPKVVDTDERPRRDTTVESLAKLKADFRDGGTVALLEIRLD